MPQAVKNAALTQLECAESQVRTLQGAVAADAAETSAMTADMTSKYHALEQVVLRYHRMLAMAMAGEDSSGISVAVAAAVQ